MKKTSKQNNWVTFWVSAGAMVLFGLAGFLLVFLAGNGAESPSQWEWAVLDGIDADCKPGPLEGDWPDEDPTPYGTLRYQLNTAPWFSDCDAEGTVCFQNNQSNCHPVQISYVLENGEEVYRSGWVLPGSHIQTAQLSVRLAQGEYTGVCRIALFDPDSLQLLGELEEPIQITIAH